MLMNKRTFSSHCHKYQMPSLRLRNSCCASLPIDPALPSSQSIVETQWWQSSGGENVTKGWKSMQNSRLHVIGKGIDECAVLATLEARNSFVRPYRNSIFLFSGGGSILLPVAYIHTIDIHAAVFIYYIVCRHTMALIHPSPASSTTQQKVM